MNENLDKLKRAITYLFRPGNLLYWGLFALIIYLNLLELVKNFKIAIEIYQAHNLTPDCNPYAPDCFQASMEISDATPFNFGLFFLQMTVLFIFFCKVFDGIMRISEGMEDEPVPYAPVSIIPFLTPLKHLAGIIIIFLVTLPLAFLFGTKFWQLFFQTLFIFFLPIMIMNLLGNDSIASMISPRAWIITIKNLGIRDYLALLFIPALVTVPLVLLLNYIARINNLTLLLILGSIITAFTTALGLIYIGYFMRGEAPQGLSEAELRVLHEADTYRMDDDEKKQFAQDLLAADTLQAEGGFEQMEALLLPYTSAQKNIAQYFPAYRRLYEHYAIHRRYDTLQTLEQRLTEAATQGNERCYLLVRKAVENMALDDPARLPADWIQPLARMAIEHNDYDIVLALTRNFAQRHPDHKHILENYYCAARALDKKGQRDKSLHLLQQLIDHYPDHPKIAQVRRTLERLQQAGQHKTSPNKPH